MAIGPRDDFQKVTVGVTEVDPASPVAVIDRAGLSAHRVRPMRAPQLSYPTEHAVEVGFADQERVVLRLYRPFVMDEVEGCAFRAIVNTQIAAS